MIQGKHFLQIMLHNNIKRTCFIIELINNDILRLSIKTM